MNQKVRDAIELMPLFYQGWFKKSSNGNMLECAEREFRLRRTYEAMFRCLGRQICKDHNMEYAFGRDPDRTSSIPKDAILSDRAQEIYDEICLFVGLDPRK